METTSGQQKLLEQFLNRLARGQNRVGPAGEIEVVLRRIDAEMIVDRREHVLRRHHQSFFQSRITAAAGVIGKGGGMTLTAVAGKNPDVAADQADGPFDPVRTDIGCLLGRGTS